MKLASYAGADGTPRLALVHAAHLWDVEAATHEFAPPGSPTPPAALRAALELDAPGYGQLVALDRRIRAAPGTAGEWCARGIALPLAAAPILLPFTPRAVICTGNNYREHLDEKARQDIRDAQGDDIEFFQKLPECFVGPDAPVTLVRAITAKLDYENELAVIIGREAWRATPVEAAACIFGYTVMNDLSARDRQLTVQGCPKLGLSKNFEGCGALGPWVVTADEFATPLHLDLLTTVNGEVRQRSNTRYMIRDPAFLVSHFSRFFKLRPGYVLATGTVGGTAWSTDAALGGVPYAREDIVRGGYLRAGDTVVCSIGGIGELRNFIVA